MPWAFTGRRALLGAQLRRGVVWLTTAADCDREARTGLYVYEADGELLVFRTGDTLYPELFLQQARPTLPDVPNHVVTEAGLPAQR